MQKCTVFLPAFISVFSLCVCGLGGCRFCFLIKAVMDGDDKAQQCSAADNPPVSSSLSSELACVLLPGERTVTGSAGLGVGGCCSSLVKCLAG